MAPMKAVLRSKLDKADTAKSLKDLVDKYEVSSEAFSPMPSASVDHEDDHASDSEIDMASLSPYYPQPQQQHQQHLQQQQQQQQQQLPELPTLFPRPAESLEASAMSMAAPGSDLLWKQLQLQILSRMLYEELQQQPLWKKQQQQQQQQPQQQQQDDDEQPLNLSFNPLKRHQAVEDESEAKRHCPAPAATVATEASVTSVQRKRKRSYRLSDNEEIRAYQASAPELFAWNGHKPMIHQFLLKLLNNPSCSGLIRWLDRDSRLFKVLQPGSVARLWQFIKGNRTDNYECFARGIRHSRDIGKYFEAHEFRKKKVYKFSEKALLPATSEAAAEQSQDEAEEKLMTKPRPQQPQPANVEKLPLPELPAQTASSYSSNNSNSSSPFIAADRKIFNSDVMARLKSKLADRLQLQKQQQKSAALQAVKSEPTVKAAEEAVFEDDVDSPLVIADCEHL